MQVKKLQSEKFVRPTENQKLNIETVKLLYLKDKQIEKYSSIQTDIKIKFKKNRHQTDTKINKSIKSTA